MSTMPAEILSALASAKSTQDVEKILAEYTENQRYDAVVEKCYNKFTGVDRAKAVDFIKEVVEVANQAGLYISGKPQSNSTQHSIGFEFDDMDISLRVTVKDNK